MSTTDWEKRSAVLESCRLRILVYRLVCLFFAVFFVLGANVYAVDEGNEVPKEPSALGDDALFTWDITIFGLTLMYNNESSFINYGIRASMLSALREYEDSRNLLDSYYGKRTWGTVLFYTGFVVSIAGLIVPFASDLENVIPDFSGRLYLGVGIVAGGLLTGIGGGLMQRSGQADLINATKSYNAHQLDVYE